MEKKYEIKIKNDKLLIKNEKNIIIFEDDSYFYINKKEKKLEYCLSKDFINKEFNEDILFRIRKSKKTGEYEIINPINILSKKTENYIKILENKIWYKIPEEKGYIINEGDIIKFSDKMFEIIKIGIWNENKNVNEEDIISNINKKVGSIFDLSVKYKTMEYKENKIIPDQFNLKNPYINLCQCEDGFLFYEDLKNKLNNIIFIKQSECSNHITYTCDKFFCEKCGAQYPYKFKIPESEKIYDLIDIKHNYKNYIIMEYLNNDLNIKDKIIHIIDENEKIIGREIIDSKKISRKHSYLILDKGKFILKNESKAGTYVLIKNGLKINKNDIQFKVGKFNFIVGKEE